jgi:hypothetical protein
MVSLDDPRRSSYVSVPGYFSPAGAAAKIQRAKEEAV